MGQKQERKTDRDKTPTDIILKVVTAVKIHNLFDKPQNFL